MCYGKGIRESRGSYIEMPRSWHIFRGIGRLHDAVTPAAARAELAAIAAQLAASEPDYAESGLAFDVELLQEDLVAHVEPALLALFGAVALLLVIASFNVASPNRCCPTWSELPSQM